MAALLKPQPSLIVYSGFSGFGTYVWSPFVTKLQARLRFAGVSYRADMGAKSNSPRGKLPYISIQNEGTPPEILSDTTLIVKKLVEDGLLEDLNLKLSPADKTHDLAIRALLEDKLYFYQGYEKWHQNYYTMRSGVLSALPYPLQVIVGLLAYRGNMQTLYGQGTARFSPEELSSFKLEIWENISSLLEVSRSKSTDDGPFWVLGTREPTEVDATAFGFISAAFVCSAAPETMKVVKSFPVLNDYARRIHDHYFPEYTSWEE